MKNIPILFTGIIAVVLTLLGWLLFRSSGGQVIRLPDRVRVG